jgi:hypothetical protein
MAASWPGLTLTVLGCGSLTYGLYASSTAFCIAAGALGGPGIALLLGTCASYCCDQAENDEEIALVPRTNASTPISMNSSGPTAIPSTAGNPIHEQALQDWHASQPEIEERLRRKSLQVPLQEGVTSQTTGDASNQIDQTTVSNTDMRKLRRQTASNPNSHRDLRVRSGKPVTDEEQRTPRKRTASQVERRSSTLRNNTHSGDGVSIDQGGGILDDLAETELEYARLLALHNQSRGPSLSSSDSSEHKSNSDSH